MKKVRFKGLCHEINRDGVNVRKLYVYVRAGAGLLNLSDDPIILNSKNKNLVVYATHPTRSKFTKVWISISLLWQVQWARKV